MMKENNLADQGSKSVFTLGGSPPRSPESFRHFCDFDCNKNEWLKVFIKVTFSKESKSYKSELYGLTNGRRVGFAAESNVTQKSNLKMPSQT